MIEINEPHGWVIRTLSYLVDYSENENLPDVAAELIGTLEVVAPMLARPVAGGSFPALALGPGDMPSDMPSDIPSDIPSDMPGEIPGDMSGDMSGNIGAPAPDPRGAQILYFPHTCRAG